MLCWMVGNTAVQHDDADDLDHQQDQALQKVMKVALTWFSWNSSMLAFLSEHENLKIPRSMLIVNYCVGTDKDEQLQLLALQIYSGILRHNLSLDLQDIIHGEDEEALGEAQERLYKAET